ncbi:hypothetical protein IG631_09725 [Alternaria alternata]|nr:hypothetical protein IG631_09725 [Alternaria alternata]
MRVSTDIPSSMYLGKQGYRNQNPARSYAETHLLPSCHQPQHIGAKSMSKSQSSTCRVSALRPRNEWHLGIYRYCTTKPPPPYPFAG